MKRILLSLMILVAGFSAQKVEAQNVIEKGASVVNVGAGAAVVGFPIVGSYDYGLIGNLFDDKSALTLGGAVGTVLGDRFGTSYAGPRVGIHYHFIPNLDLYATSMLGYKVYYAKITDEWAFGSGLAWSTSLGVRYFFTPTIGVFSETGLGFIGGSINAGISFKF